MSLSVAQILVESERAADVEQVAAESLFRWAAGVGELPPDEDGSVPPAPERRLVLLPPTGGWIALLEEEGRVDRSLARELRDRLGVRAVVAELDGPRLGAALEILDGDGESREWVTPAEPADGRMPLYEDAEAELQRRLAELGVPAALVAPAWEDLVDQTTPSAEGCRLLAIAGREGLDKTVIPFGEIDDDPSPRPMTRPDLWVAAPDGRARVVESRRVWGRPHRAAAEALVDVEDRQLARMLPVLARATDAERVPEVLFGYDGSDDDDALAAALEEARERRPLLWRRRREPLLSVRGLAAALREHLAARHRDVVAGRTCGRRLELRHAALPSWSLFTDLDGLWDAYFAAPDDDGLVARRVEAALREGAQPHEYDEALALPTLVGNAPDLPTLAVRPFVRGVWIGLGMDTGAAMVPVTRAMLARAQVGFEDALDAAIVRLDRLTEENDSFVIYEQPEGVTVRAEFPDLCSGARILSERVRGHVAQQLGDGCRVAVPSRDLLLAAERTREARAWLEREVARRFAGSDVPLTRMIWSIQNGELEEEGEAPPLAAWEREPEAYEPDPEPARHRDDG